MMETKDVRSEMRLVAQEVSTAFSCREACKCHMELICRMIGTVFNIAC
jgi:hypothetical protein